MLTDLSEDLAIIAVYVHTIFILKTDVCSAYMSIHPCRMMAASLFITVDLFIFIYWDYDSDIWLFAKFKSD